MAVSPGGLSPRLRPAPSQRKPDADEIFATFPTPALVIGPRGEIDSANVAALTLFNTGVGHLRELGAARLLGELGSMFVDRDDEALRRAYDIGLKTADGGGFNVDIAIATIPDRPGWRVAAIHPRGSARLGERRAGRDKAQLSAVGAAAMLAHEIKNPLSGIRGAAQLLASNADPDSAELTTLIREEVDRIAKLIDRMEGFTDSRAMLRAPLNIHTVLDHVFELATTGFGKDAEIVREYDPSLPDIIGNRDALVQIFLNLLKNAIEATENKAKPHVVIQTAYRHGISVRKDAGQGRLALPIEVAIRDNGSGAPEALVAHLFDPFVTSKRTGTGLGLALVDKLVTDHESIVEYQRDEAGSETIFRVLLPRAGETL